MQRALGITMMVVAVAIVLLVWYLNSTKASAVQPFSAYNLLSASWENYKTTFINEDGRVIDFTLGDVTTSEGQSYAMLRAVWSDDRETFDRVWKWTSTTLKRPDDNLFGWKWGKPENGEYGFWPEGGENSASDADSDIALALILAGRRWREDEYINQAQPILEDLWDINTTEIQDKRYFIAGNWAGQQDTVIINPSYFSPYAWEIFAEVDTERDWKSLITPSYELLEAASKDPLAASSSALIPPDWVAVDRRSGTLSAPQLPDLTTNYSYDAMRVPWRIALDYKWNKRPEAERYLSNYMTFFLDSFRSQGKLISTYSHSGEPLTDYENPTLYATLLPLFQIRDPNLAKDLYDTKVAQLYSPDTNTFNKELPYYEQNWLWFGIALYYDKLLPFNRE